MSELLFDLYVDLHVYMYVCHYAYSMAYYHLLMLNILSSIGKQINDKIDRCWLPMADLIGSYGENVHVFTSAN